MTEVALEACGPISVGPKGKHSRAGLVDDGPKLGDGLPIRFFNKGGNIPVKAESMTSRRDDYS